MNKHQRSTRTLIWHCFIIGAVLTLGVSLFAQSYRGSIRGNVRDGSGAIIVGATVTAKNVATGETRTAASGPDGGYVIAEVPAGQYEVTAASTGLVTVTARVLVAVGTDTTADFDLARVQAAQSMSPSPPLFLSWIPPVMCWDKLWIRPWSANSR